MTSATFVPSHKLSRTPVEYIVEGMIPETGVGILYAPSTQGKSLVATKLGLDMVNGLPFFGHETVKGDVVICLAEGEGDAGIRLEALIASSRKEIPRKRCRGTCQLFNCSCKEVWFPSEEGLWYWKKTFSLSRETDVLAAITQIKAAGPDVRLVMLDTLQLYAGGTISWPTNAIRVMGNMKAMSRALNCFTLAIHHTNKDEETMQGNQALFNASDVVIRIKDHTLINEKQKAGPLFEPVSYEIITVKWVDRETRKPVTSAFVSELMLDDAAPLRKPPKRTDRTTPLLTLVEDPRMNRNQASA